MIKVREHVPLAAMTTFKIGGKARYFVEVKNEDELREALYYARERTLPFFILAGGSNLLIADDGIDALVIKMTSDKSAFSGSLLTADAGCVLLEEVQKASILGLGGWEQLSGIPGTIGGAARGNAGAFGTEMRDVVSSVRAMNSISFEFKDFSNTECDFAYRNSFFKRHPEWIITSVTVSLQKVDAKVSIRLGKDTVKERERRHIQDVQAAGSYFMNPIAPDFIRELFEKEKDTKSREGRVPAGWLIEKADMKGVKVGGAQASQQHPNYLVNTGRATSKDVLELAKQIKEVVMTRFSVQLQEEAVVVG